MMEEKSTPKRATAAKKTAASAAPTASEASKTPAVKKAPPAAAEKKTPARKAVQTPEIATQPTPAPQTAAAPATHLAASTPAETVTPDLTPAPAKPSAEERYLMVQSAAYFIAERNGFQGCDTHYWALAEQEIAAQLGETAA